MWVAFAVQKLLTFSQQKIIIILYIESAKTVNEMTLNKLVKLTMLWTTGPRNAKYLHVDNEDWSICVDVQAVLSLHWANMSEGKFSQIMAQNIL